ncbi:MAG: phage baseplate assembly protein [Hyphomicrobiaceae bacterium]
MSLSFGASSMAALASLPYAPGTVTLLVGGMLYTGWTSVEVRRSVKRMAGEFTLVVEERWTGGAGGGGPASLLEWRIRPGDPCQVFYLGLPVITGHVDAYNPRYAATSHTVTIQGRSKTGDLCDSSAIIPNGEMNNVGLDQVARRAIDKYGIGLKNEAQDLEPFDRVSVWPGETVHRFLDRYARPGAVSLTDDEQGNLRLLQVEDAGPAASLVEGVNILEASAMLRGDTRHSEYNVLGQDRGTDAEYGKPVAQRRSRVRDGAVKRHRPLVLLNETKTSRKASRSRGAWEAARRAGESTRVEVKVFDWCYAPGQLWQPGMIVQVTSPMLAVNRTLALEGVVFTLSERGTLAALSLVPVEALNPKGGKGQNAGDKAWADTKPEGEPEDMTGSADGLNF